MSKSDRIRQLLARGLEVKEIAKRTGATLNLVHQVRWQGKKAKKKNPVKATFKSPRSKLIQAVFQANRDIEAVKAKPITVAMHHSNIDYVNSPPHYKTGGIEVLDFIEAKDLNYRLGNVVKYVSRAGKKTNSDPVQDLEKAAFYLKREIDARKQA